MNKITRLQVRVTGIVQGVGFRPFIYRLAVDKGLSGWVRNDSDGVIIEVQGEEPLTRAFIKDIEAKRPPLARIDNLSCMETALQEETPFIILETENKHCRQTLISPDVALCSKCKKELFEPGDRRYRYPFINCTDCGPRYTIIRDIPYDRVNTTMERFQMCPECMTEYKNPLDRRFHAEPNACPECGPEVYLLDNQEQAVPGDPVREAVKLLKAGYIIAVKGLGGYHLACNAADAKAVARLRAGKNREGKPFAIMARDLGEVARFCLVNAEEKELLTSSKSPIVLLHKKPVDSVAKGVAPEVDTFGVMLPYTPLHHLLLEEIPVGLVMTSGNHSSEPIIYRDEDALEKLKEQCDYFLINNRPIYQRCDDSVVRSFQGREMVLRRSRGYVPAPVKLPFDTMEILACGAELKNTFCVTKGNQAFISQHIGDLKNPESLGAYEEGIQHLQRIFDINPRIIAHDLHPDYLSTGYAEEWDKGLHIGVQHHHAHIASCMAENGITDKVIGLSFDGTGYGTDGHLWGGEFLICDYKDFQRAGHLQYIPMASGEQAIKEPWRLAAVYLKLALGEQFTELPIEFSRNLNIQAWSLLNQSLVKGINAPLTSSMGRLFDAVSAMLGICQRVSYEGQAAIELEQQADREVADNYKFAFDKGEEIIVDTLPIIRGIAEDLVKGRNKSYIAGKFHNTIAELSLDMCSLLRERSGINSVALSGGVFQNVLLLGKMINKLKDAGFKVYTHSQVPPNDGGICLGQAAIANERGKDHVFGCTG